MTAQIEAADFFAFDNSYARLPGRFFALLRPTPVAAPHLVRLNKKLAWHLRLDPGKLAAPEGVEILAGNRVPKRGEPLAMTYAGHQFGTFVPQLGDGRAILLGEVIDRDGVRATSSSRGLAQHRFLGGATDARRSGLFSANTSSARRWRRLGFRRPERSPL